MVPEISSAMDTIFCHFGSLFTLLPPNNQENQNFEKMKKMPGDISILHMCTINDDHMMYGSQPSEIPKMTGSMICCHRKFSGQQD